MTGSNAGLLTCLRINSDMHASHSCTSMVSPTSIADGDYVPKKAISQGNESQLR